MNQLVLFEDDESHVTININEDNIISVVLHHEEYEATLTKETIISNEKLDDCINDFKEFLTTDNMSIKWDVKDGYHLMYENANLYIWVVLRPKIYNKYIKMKHENKQLIEKNKELYEMISILFKKCKNNSIIMFKLFKLIANSQS
jgi:hypothetical protein